MNDDDLRDLEDSELRFVPVSIQQLARAVTQVESCEKCYPEAEIPFDWILRAFVDPTTMSITFCRRLESVQSAGLRFTKNAGARRSEIPK